MIRRIATVALVAAAVITGAGVTEANAYVAPTAECFLAPCPTYPAPLPVAGRHHHMPHHHGWWMHGLESAAQV